MSEFNYNNNLNNKDNSKKKVLLIVIPIITALFVIGGFVGHKIYNKSIDDTSTDTTVAESEVTEENITSELTRETKHTTKKIDYIPGMPSSDYKKMKEAPTTTEVAKEESTTEETTEDTTKKTSTEQTTQAPKETPTEQPKETPTEQPTEAPTEPSTEAPKEPATEAPKEEDHGERKEGNTYYGHYETQKTPVAVAADGTTFRGPNAVVDCDNYCWETNQSYSSYEEETSVWVWDR